MMISAEMRRVPLAAGRDWSLPRAQALFTPLGGALGLLGEVVDARLERREQVTDLWETGSDGVRRRHAQVVDALWLSGSLVLRQAGEAALSVVADGPVAAVSPPTLVSPASVTATAVGQVLDLGRAFVSVDGVSRDGESLVAGVDYAADGPRGLLQVLALAGSPPESWSVTLSDGLPAQGWRAVDLMTGGGLVGALELLGVGTVSPRLDLVLPRVRLVPQGPWPLAQVTLGEGLRIGLEGLWDPVAGHGTARLVDAL